MPDASLVGRGGDQGAQDAAHPGGHDEVAGPGALRIVSLLPSATETLFALGLGNQLVAVTHECDYPPEAALLPIVTRSTLGLEDQDSGGIEAAVSLAAAEGRSLYEVDTAAIRDLRPDLVIAQDVCRVCAVSADQVAGELDGIPMIRQHPHSLADVLADIEEVASACGADPQPLMAGLHARLDAATRDARRRGNVRGVFLEWIDPPYRAGHWTPDLLTLAGIEDPLARAGVPSVALSWPDVVAARPELLILAPCGFTRDRALEEAALVQTNINEVGAARVVVLDGSAYFNRPGPRLVDSLEQLVANR
jgi:iron complex transport system substrate-binding protein